MEKIKFKLDENGFLSEVDAKKYFSTLGLAVFLMELIIELGSFAVGFVAGYFAPWVFESSLALNIISVLLIYALGFPVFYAVLRRLPRDRVTPERMGGKSLFGGLCVAMLAMEIGSYISQFVILSFENILGRPLNNPVAESTSDAWWINLLFVGILAPILEELVYRKFLCERLLPLGEGYAVLLSAVVFGLVHGNFFQFFYAFATGLLFGLIYVKTGKLRYTIGYHAFINIMGGVLVPYLYGHIEPILTEEGMEQLLTISESGDPLALAEFMEPYLIPTLLLGLYTIFMYGTAIAGLVILIKNMRRIRLEKGLLPPPKQGKVANIFCNFGVAAAITGFVAIFLLSLFL